MIKINLIIAAVWALIFINALDFLGETVSSSETSESFFAEERAKMVRDQIEARGINDSRVIKALKKVKRHLFVPEKQHVSAYADSPLPIGEDQTISQPYIVAFMTEVLRLRKTDRVLEIGTGSGYQAAILAEICDEVYSIEIIKSLGSRAAGVLKKLGYTNVSVRVGDGYKGWEEHAPFDAIIVTCAPSEIPEPLKEQLAEGGRMIIPVGGAFPQHLVLLKKKNGSIKEEAVLSVMFVPMVNKKGAKY